MVDAVDPSDKGPAGVTVSIELAGDRLESAAASGIRIGPMRRAGIVRIQGLNQLGLGDPPICGVKVG